MKNDRTTPSRKPYSVSELTSEIKGTLEQNFAFIWISGEISNFKIPASRHFYFILKDSAAQIQSVMFKGQNRNLKFLPEDGMKITGFGRVGVYAPRGSYQIIFEYLEPAGAGALQAAFEQLKKKLDNEGLFSADRKRSLPFLPTSVVIISSPTGAVVHDIIRVMHRRFENIFIRILPVKVQGDDAVDQIVEAFAILNDLTGVDVAILARGGGSLEDLAPFNSERVARAIAASRVPVVSAVGHETDFTIADFVADLRAPTPSAAAELVAPVKSDLIYILSLLDRRMYAGIIKWVEKQRLATENLEKRIGHPAKRLGDLRLKTDDLSFRMNSATIRLIASMRERTEMYTQRLHAQSPAKRVFNAHGSLSAISTNLKRSIYVLINLQRQALLRFSEHLGALDPEAILSRGYSITRTLPCRSVVIDADAVSPGQMLEVVLARGRLVVSAEQTGTTSNPCHKEK